MSLRRVALSTLFLALCLTAQADVLKFVVAGDDRVDPKAPAFPSGINETVLKDLAARMKSENPVFMLFSGDLGSGVIGNVKTKLSDQLKAWVDLMTPYGIPYLPARGNHETYSGTENMDDVWMNQFGKIIADNQVPGITSENPFNYAYTPPGHPEVLILALDTFQAGHPHFVDVTWVKKVIEAKKAKHVFAFLHEMAFTCGSHLDNLSSNRQNRDDLLDLLQKSGCKCIFAGHDHLYDHMVITKKAWQPDGYAMHQFVAGTAGAPFYDDQTYDRSETAYKLVRAGHFNQTYGYLLVTVDGDKVHVDFKGRTEGPALESVDIN